MGQNKGGKNCEIRWETQRQWTTTTHISAQYNKRKSKKEKEIPNNGSVLVQNKATIKMKAIKHQVCE